jgi:hypothetical protein
MVCKERALLTSSAVWVLTLLIQGLLRTRHPPFGLLVTSRQSEVSTPRLSLPFSKGRTGDNEGLLEGVISSLGAHCSPATHVLNGVPDISDEMWLTF